MTTTRTITAADFISGYGPDFTDGVLTEHAARFVEVGGTIRDAASGSGRAWAVVDGRAVPLVCSELIPWTDEDGPTVLRCGTPALADGCCPSHGAALAAYRSMSEAERAFGEYASDGAWV